MQYGSGQDVGSNEEIGRLLAMTRDELLAVFRTLEAPPIGQLVGFYSGHLPYEIEAVWHAFVARSGIGEWLGKSFLDEAGERRGRRGFNSYRQDGEIRHRLGFDTTEGTSRYDGRPSIVLHYGPYPHWAGQNDLVDEVRVVAPGTLLGLYHTRTPIPGFSPRSDGDRSAPEFFVLTATQSAARTARGAA